MFDSLIVVSEQYLMSPVEGAATLVILVEHFSSFRTSQAIRSLLILCTILFLTILWVIPCTVQCVFLNLWLKTTFLNMIVKHFIATFHFLDWRVVGQFWEWVYFVSGDIDNTNSPTPTVFAECHDCIHNRQTDSVLWWYVYSSVMCFHS